MTNFIRTLRSCAAILLASAFVFVTAAPATAQKQATTIEQLTRRAPLVFRIRVVRNHAVGRRIELRFEVLESLAGKLSVEPKIVEPLARHCGSACHGLNAGQRLVLFAELVRGSLRPIGGARGLVHVGRGELAVIRALLRERDASKRLSLVGAQLQHPSARVREDAALSLAHMPGLEKANVAFKAQLQAALQRSLTENSIQIYGLLTASIRAAPERAAETAWSLVLETKRRGLESLGRRVLLKEVDARYALASAPLAAASVSSRLRVARLISDLASPLARGPLERLARDRTPDVRSEALIGLLDLGVRPTGLVKSYGAREVQGAVAERIQRRKKRFRAIRPQR